MSRGDDEPVISEDETVKLLQALGRGQSTFSTEDGEAVVRWAHETRIAATLLEMALSGEMVIRLREDGELLFGTDRS